MWHVELDVDTLPEVAERGITAAVVQKAICGDRMEQSVGGKGERENHKG